MINHGQILYTRILLHSHEAPTNWYSADIILLPKFKGGDPSKPENFGPIAKTTTVAKLFYKILARCLENYFTANDIIDTTIQKGFLTGSNGIMEHNHTCITNRPRQCKETPLLTGHDPRQFEERIWFCQPQFDFPNVGSLPKYVPTLRVHIYTCNSLPLCPPETGEPILFQSRKASFKGTPYPL